MEVISVRGEARVDGDPNDMEGVVQAAQDAALEDAWAKARAEADQQGLRLGSITEQSEWHQGYNPDHPRLRCTVGWPEDIARAEETRPWTVEGWLEVTFAMKSLEG